MSVQSEKNPYKIEPYLQVAKPCIDIPERFSNRSKIRFSPKNAAILFMRLDAFCLLAPDSLARLASSVRQIIHRESVETINETTIRVRLRVCRNIHNKRIVPVHGQMKNPEPRESFEVSKFRVKKHLDKKRLLGTGSGGFVCRVESLRAAFEYCIDCFLRLIRGCNFKSGRNRHTNS